MVITSYCFKGGSGKSTTAATLAQAAAYNGKRVLCIDLDPQRNLTMFTGGQADGASYRLMNGEPVADLVQKTPQGVDLIAAGVELATVTTRPGSASRLYNALQPIRRKYKYIFIDVPAMFGELSYNALFASDALIMPLGASIADLQGINDALEVIAQITQASQTLKKFYSCVTNFYSLPKVNRNIRESLEEMTTAAGMVYAGTVRRCTALQEAQVFRESLYRYAPRCNAAIDYMEILKKIDRRC